MVVPKNNHHTSMSAVCWMADYNLQADSSATIADHQKAKLLPL